MSGCRFPRLGGGVAGIEWRRRGDRDGGVSEEVEERFKRPERRGLHVHPTLSLSVGRDRAAIGKDRAAVGKDRAAVGRQGGGWQGYSGGWQR